MHDHLAAPSLDGPLQRLPAAVKLLVAMLLLIALALPGTSPLVLALGAIVLIALAVASRVPARVLVKRFLLLEPFVLGIALLSWLQPHGGRVFALTVTRTSTCLFTVILLVSTTAFPDLLRVMRRARVPAILLTTLALTYRYLFVLLEESTRMRRARASRTFGRRRVVIWRSLGNVVGQLFIRSSERAERIYAAMCARGWK